MTVDEAFQLVAIAVDGISARAMQRFEADLIAMGVSDARDHAAGGAVAGGDAGRVRARAAADAG